MISANVLIARTLAAARGQSRYRLFDDIRDRLHGPREAVEEYRLGVLVRLLEHAYRTTVAYRERLDAAGLGSSGVRTAGDLGAIAVVTKDEMRARHDAFVSTECDISSCERKSTSGSSGEPFTFFRDREYFELGAAGMLRGMAVAGWEPGEAIAHCWGYETDVDSLRKRLGSRLSGTYYLNAFRQDEAAMDGWATTIRENRIKFIYGYPSSLYWFGRHVLREGMDLPMKAVFCTAEKYYGFEREAVERAFQCKSYDQYGSSEVQNIAFECPRGNMHVADDFVVLQAVADPHPIPRLIATSLHNRCMPFIRYDLGDFGCLLKEECGCGINTPLVRIDGGSKYDFLTTPSGIVHGAVLERVFNKIAGVARYQIVQHDVSSYTVRCEMTQNAEANTRESVEASAEEVLTEIIGEPVDIRFEYPGKLEGGPGGKYRFIWRE